MGFSTLIKTLKFIWAFTRRFWPLLLALAALAISTHLQLQVVLDKNGGEFVYTLDDPYIHMAIAKNIVRHGVWGLTPYQFTSSSSSPLWTLLLAAAYALTGVHVLTPFILNLLFAALILGVAFLAMRPRMHSLLVFAALLALLFAPPLVPMAFSGMEHTAHLFFSLLVIILASRLISIPENLDLHGSEAAPNPTISAPSPLRSRFRSEKGSAWRSLFFGGDGSGLLVAVFCLTAVRYEGLFLLLVVWVLFMGRKRWRDAIWVGAAGLLPLVAYGLWSLAQGWYFLPNPVLIKGGNNNQALFHLIRQVLEGGQPLTLQSFSKLEPTAFITRIQDNPHILVLVILSLFFLVYQRGSFWSAVPLGQVAFTSVVVLHMQFAATGWFYRYEAYVVGMGIYAVALGFSEAMPGVIGRQSWLNKLLRLAAAALTLYLLLVPVRDRAAEAYRDIALASYNIYEQQIQMAAFLKQFYQGRVVAANDIGAINYFADIHLVDLAGLATLESAAHTLSRTFDAQQVAWVADQHHAQIALVYDSWFDIPSTWIKVGEWTIPNNIICGDDTVSFYAIDPGAALGLRDSLRAFSPQLPHDVKQSGAYR